jgi:hypothetical protein
MNISSQLFGLAQGLFSASVGSEEFGNKKTDVLGHERSLYVIIDKQ